MKYALVLILATSSCAFGQETMRTSVVYQGAGSVVATAGVMGKGMSAPVQGAPYSATITNESTQTLTDGTHIVQNSTGTIARDSQGRTRQDASLPAIGNLSAADAPHLVFIQDPVAQTSYTLNLTDKTAFKNAGLAAMALPSLRASIPAGEAGPAISIRGVAGPLTAPAQTQMMTIQSSAIAEEGQPQTEDLGSKTM